MKNAVLGYAAILLLSGLATHIVLGVDLLQEGDNRGIAVLGMVLIGVVLALIYLLRLGKDERAPRGVDTKQPDGSWNFRTTASAEYPFTNAVVWALVRPAEFALLVDDNLAQAFKVPGTPDGIGERQCFITHDGRVSLTEVVDEIPGRWAETRAICPPGFPSAKTIYRLEPTEGGCRLVTEAVLESSSAISGMQKKLMEEHGRWFLDAVGQALERRAAGRTTPSV